MREPARPSGAEASLSPFVAIRWLRDDGWRVESIEGDIAALTGYPAQAFLDGSVDYADILHEQDSPVTFERIGLAAASDIVRLPLMYRIVTRDGSERRVWDDTRILRDEQGVPLRFVSFIVALDLLPVSRNSSDFVAHASHEIRTPLTGVVGLTDALAHTALDAEQRDIVEALQESCADLMQLVNNILDLARLDAGAMELDIGSFRPSALCQGTERLFARRAQAKGVAIRSRGTAGDMSLRGDAGRLRQILHNLVGNAVKFTDQGSVTIGWECAPPDAFGRVRLVLSVADTGPGMPPDVLGRIFESYVQADAAVATRHGGTGLGLSIARALATMMGGRLVAESRLGEGSVFRFEAMFDIAAGEQSDVALLEREEAQAAARALIVARRPRVLAVEDATAIQRVIDLLLRPLGAEVSIARDGLEAVEQFAGGRFDLVLMDSRLPRLGGIEALTEIRGIERREGRVRTPVLALTADAQPKTAEAFMKAGADGFLPKPFEPQRLIKTIASLLSEAVGDRVA